MAKRGNVLPTYRKAIALAEELMPEYFAADKRVLESAPESVNARLYRQLARLESLGTGVQISPYEYARREFDKLSNELLEHEGGKEDLVLAKNRLDQIRACMLELRPRAYSEHKSIFGDVLLVERNLPVSGEGRDYKQRSDRWLEIARFVA